MMEYKLEDLFDLQMGRTPARSNVEYWNTKDNKWISIGDLTKCDKYINSTKEYISNSAVIKSGINQIPAGTVVMSFKLSIGKAAITTETMYSNEAIMAFIDKQVVDLSPDYVYYLLSGQKWELGTNKAVMGATLNKSSLARKMVKIHDANTQKVIVKKLNLLNDIINKRKTQLLELETLIKARFVEMFGDPVSNPKGMVKKTLPELGEFGRGVSKHRPRNDKALLGGPYPLIQTGDIANSGMYITEYHSTYSELGLRQSKMWDKGTLCITIAANIAKTAILGFDACFPDSVVGFNANESTNNVFVHYWFSFFQEILESQAPESAQKNINLKILSELEVIVPDIQEQNKFASFVEQVDKSKSVVQKALAEAQTLFNSLMQQYFG